MDSSSCCFKPARALKREIIQNVDTLVEVALGQRRGINRLSTLQLQGFNLTRPGSKISLIQDLHFKGVEISLPCLKIPLRLPSMWASSLFGRIALSIP